VKLEYAPRALASIRYRQRWWQAHRDRAGLFGDELRAALRKIRDNTEVARQRYSGQGEATTWRLLMPKTRHHVYYVRDEQNGIARVLFVANAIGESGPDL
jgi:hypothetical protein